MPGITGIIRKNAHEDAERDLERMGTVMRHESDYCWGQYVSRELGLYLGWTCHPGTFSSSMPLVSQSRDVVLIFHGEDYLTGETPNEGSSAHSAIKAADANYLLRLYEESGENFVRELNGWFCGVLADIRSKKIILFNDRYGMGRIYVHEGKDEILFSSEAKSLLKVRPDLRAIDPEALAQYLRCNCVMGNRSLFRNIELLPGGSSWSFDSKICVKKQRYFDFKEWEQQETLPPDEFYERFSSTMSRIVPVYAQGARKVALSLTAGLDTRVIMASLHAHDRSFPCYTFGGTWGETFDIRTARKLASIYNQPYEAIRINGDFLNDFAGFAERSVYLSDGTHDAFGAHDVYFNQLARKIAPIRLTGKFGSEIVRVRKIIPFSQFPANVVASDLRPFLQSVPSLSQVTQLEHPLSRAVCEEIPWYEFGRVAVEQSQLTLRTPYMDNELVKLMFQAPYALRSAGELQALYTRDHGPALSRIVTNMGKMATSNPLFTSLLYPPYWALFKAEYIYLYATPHWLTRIDRWLGSWHLERLLSGRQKFEGYRIWIKTHFANFVREKLLNPQAKYTRYFDYQSVSEMVERHTAGSHNYLNEINKVLTTELICSSLLNP